MGKCIVSERSTVDEYLDLLYLESLFFVSSLNDIYETVSVFIKFSQLRKAMERKALSFFGEIDSNITNLKMALEYSIKKRFSIK
jgi:hypothetical protein